MPAKIIPTLQARVNAINSYLEHGSIDKATRLLKESSYPQHSQEQVRAAFFPSRGSYGFLSKIEHMGEDELRGVVARLEQTHAARSKIIQGQRTDPEFAEKARAASKANMQRLWQDGQAVENIKDAASKRMKGLRQDPTFNAKLSDAGKPARQDQIRKINSDPLILARAREKMRQTTQSPEYRLRRSEEEKARVQRIKREKEQKGT